MIPIKYKNVKEGLYEIDQQGNIYSNYKKGYLLPKKDKDGYLHYYNGYYWRYAE